jgi:hypothetical protein
VRIASSVPEQSSRQLITTEKCANIIFLDENRCFKYGMFIGCGRFILFPHFKLKKNSKNVCRISQ